MNITTLFLDIGNVLLTNGWDRGMRREAAEKFNLDAEEMNERHHLTFDTYEGGKLSLDEYLTRLVFYEDRPFTREDFKTFMFAQSQQKPEMAQTTELIKGLKAKYGLKVATVSNEGLELTRYRIKKFNLGSYVDFFISSCFVHYRKPDSDLYCLALDCAQVMPEQVVYLDDRLMFVEVARGLGIHGIHHTGFAATRDAFGCLGLSLAE
ncbi:MAG: HAD family phosphatase [Deltaproteobacteria bacterium]|nr:HAD family phosphatase [Deltaproteobacteria bacterium]